VNSTEVEGWRRALEKRSIPPWFAYTGSAARDYVRWSSTAEYRGTCWALEDEIRVLNSIAQDSDDIAFVDLGSGLGDHFIALLSSPGVKTVVRSYLATDVNAEFAKQAHSRARAAGLRSSAGDTWNFEEAPSSQVEIWRRGEPKNRRIVLGLLGLTLGNCSRPSQVLQHLSLSTSEDDLLIITVGTLQGSSDDLDRYNSVSFLSACFGPFRRLGLQESDARLQVILEDNAFVGRLRVTRPLELAGVWLSSSSCIEFFRSTRFDEQGVANLAKSSSWAVEDSRLATNGVRTVLLRHR
jgi:hypothetical protein